jgi:hypothetical protein
LFRFSIGSLPALLCLFAASVLGNSPRACAQQDNPQNAAAAAINPTKGNGNGSKPADMQGPAQPPPTATAADKQNIQDAVTALSKEKVEITKVQQQTAALKKYTDSIETVVAVSKVEPKVALDGLQSLEAAVSGIVGTLGSDTLENGLKTALKPLDGSQDGSAEKARVDACKKLSSVTTGTPGLAEAQADCTSVEKSAKDASDSLTTAQGKLKPELDKIFVYMQGQFDSEGTDHLKELCELAKKDNATTDDILPVAPAKFSALKQVIEDKHDFEKVADAIVALLAKLGVPVPPAAAGAEKTTVCGTSKADSTKDDKLKVADANLQAAVDAISLKLDEWAKTVTKSLQDSETAAESSVVSVQTDPAKNSAAAFDTAGSITGIANKAQILVDAWTPLSSDLVYEKAENFNLVTARKDFEVLGKTIVVIRAEVSRLHDALGGDFSQFDTDQVSLYYFTDVPRLMHALNDRTQLVGGIADAQAQADAKRTALVKAELDLADAQAVVNRYQKQLLDLKEQQRQENSVLKNLSSTVSRLGSRVKSSQSSKDSASADLQNAQTDANTPEGKNDPAAAAAVSRAQAKEANANLKLTQAQSDYDSAKAEQDAELKKQQDAQNQADSLPNQIKQAQADLSNAQTSVAKARRDSLVAAQQESDAFAFARDNTPYLFAPADASSTDPVKRVFLYAFNDSKTIFMRGKPDDLTVVRHIVSDFDRPVPQARLTLWTFEIDADAGQKVDKQSAKQVNQAMKIVDEELGNTRALVNTTLAYLKKLINDEVRSYEMKGSVGRSADWETPSDLQKLNRIRFFDGEIFAELNFDPNNPDKKLLRQLIPDPAGTTTLGEALMVLSLAHPETKKNIRDKFETEIRDRINGLPLPRSKGDKPGELEEKDRLIFATEVKSPANPNCQYEILPLSWHALGIWRDFGLAGKGGNCPGQPGTEGLTASQLEITRALKTAYESQVLHGVVDSIENLSTDWQSTLARQRIVSKQLSDLIDASKLTAEERAWLDDLTGELQGSTCCTTYRIEWSKDCCSLIDSILGKLVDPHTRFTAVQLIGEAQTLLATRNRIEKRWETYRVELFVLLSLYDLNVGQFSVGEQKLVPPKDRESKFIDQKKLGDSYRQYFLATSQANQPDWGRKFGIDSIDRIKLAILNSPKLQSASPRVAAADEMLKGMIIAIEDDLDRLYYQPMITRLQMRLTRESKVRVSIFQRESMLASNRGVARVDPKASAQLAIGDETDILSSVQQLAQLYAVVQSGGALGALGALQQLPREQQPEIYALTTGNKFQVTPVFDPSGQALRFKFDYVATTNLLEPNGTTNPQMPRVERHTVNTEVQLSNFETREISRYESNAKLGLPTTYWGGVPILKDIPYVRPYVPLIGWFVRKAGSGAVAQQSVIFGQTTMYPTIGDIVNLLSDPTTSQLYPDKPE